jgi:hypothetical protein
MDLSALQFVLLVVATSLQVGMAVVMVVRKLHTRLPLFFAYTVFHVGGVAVMTLATRLTYADYFYVYWSMEVLDSAISMLVIQEIFAVVLSEYESLSRLGELLFRWGTAIIVGIAVLTTAGAPGADPDRLVAGLTVLQRSVGLVETGLLLLLFLFCRWFGLTWREHVFGIALGFGLMASLVLGAGTIRTHFGAGADRIYGYASPAAFTLAVMIWAVYVFLPERRYAPEQKSRHDDLREWNRALLYLTRR